MSLLFYTYLSDPPVAKPGRKKLQLIDGSRTAKSYAFSPAVENIHRQKKPHLSSPEKVELCVNVHLIATRRSGALQTPAQR